MKAFDSIEQALEHVATTLIPARRNYIVNILPPAEEDPSDHEPPQVVSHHMEFHDNDLGLTIALPFAVQSSQFAALAQAVDPNLQTRVATTEVDGAPCDFLNLDSDAGAAAQVVRYLLENIARYPPTTSFVCIVHDEGPL